MIRPCFVLFILFVAFSTSVALNVCFLPSVALRNHVAVLGLSLGMGSLTAPYPAAATTPTETATYTNAFYHTSFEYPQEFEKKSGDVSGQRNVVAFVDPGDPDTSVSVVFNPIPGDFTRINSFGGPAGLKEYMLPDGATLVSEQVKGETYQLEYVSTDPVSSVTRHIYSVFALRPAETVVGLTVQTKEATFEANRAKLESVARTLNVHVYE